MKQTDYMALLEQTKAYALDYVSHVADKRVYPDEKSLAALSAFDGALPHSSMEPAKVLEMLQHIGEPAATAQTGGRYFGFVTGGMLPVAHAAQWLGDTWDQNSAVHAMSPLAAKLEAVCEQWLGTLLGLEPGTAAGFASGSSNATLCAMAAARDHVLEKQGWSVTEQGLQGAPAFRFVTSAEAHATVWKALSVLGIGRNQVEIVPTDECGRMRVDALPPLDEHTVLVVQAGNVNGGAFDPIEYLCVQARKAGAWVHVDGAFGLWAAASPNQKHYVRGLEMADSYALDAHKTLNLPYDCGIVLCKNREALIKSMHSQGAYLQHGPQRDGMSYTTEMSKRARALPLWAALKQLGSAGVAELIDAQCEHASYFGERLEQEAFMLPIQPFFNQLMVQCASPEETQLTLSGIQQGGICWCGGTLWKNRPAIRISVCSHATTQADIDASVQAFVQSREKARELIMARSGQPH